ncbi:MAG: hypothetical protein IKC87_00170 [Clostridia bacterium]|nr:hypothetical protein [Clostridia bacterium]
MKNPLKTKSMIILIIGAALAFVAIAALAAAGDMGEELYFVAFVCILGAAILLPWGFHERKRANNIYCPKCGYKFDYEDDVAWDLESTGAGAAGAKKSDILAITCYCRDCQAGPHKFRQKFHTGGPAYLYFMGGGEDRNDAARRFFS